MGLFRLVSEGGSGIVYGSSVGGGTNGSILLISPAGNLTSLADPNADRIVFWDDSAGSTAYLTVGSGLSISGTTIIAVAGADTQIIFNDGGALAGDAGLVFNKTTNKLTVDGIEIWSPTTQSTFVGESIGNGTLTGLVNTGFGFGTLSSITTGGNNVGIGGSTLSSLTSGDDNTAIGSSSGSGLDEGNENVFVGSNTTLTTGNISNSIALGVGAALTANNQLIIQGISSTYIGNGDVNGAPLSTIINATGGVGTDIAGGNLTIAAGKPTGAGLGGHVIIQTAAAGASGTTLRSLSTIAEFTDDAKIGFYGVTPVARTTTYSITNVTTDRSYDANATTTDEIADALGTVIADLKLIGILG